MLMLTVQSTETLPVTRSPNAPTSDVNTEAMPTALSKVFGPEGQSQRKNDESVTAIRQLATHSASNAALCEITFEVDRSAV